MKTRPWGDEWKSKSKVEDIKDGFEERLANKFRILGGQVTKKLAASWEKKQNRGRLSKEDPPLRTELVMRLSKRKRSGGRCLANKDGLKKKHSLPTKQEIIERVSHLSGGRKRKRQKKSRRRRAS